MSSRSDIIITSYRQSLLNAVHYGAESGNIWISSYQVEQKIVIDIANKGTPIPESEQK